MKIATILGTCIAGTNISAGGVLTTLTMGLIGGASSVAGMTLAAYGVIRVIEKEYNISMKDVVNKTTKPNKKKEQEKEKEKIVNNGKKKPKKITAEEYDKIKEKEVES